jgi:hypothetical protein
VDKSQQSVESPKLDEKRDSFGALGELFTLVERSEASYLIG